eukprot:1122709-Prymnesium_polylepis.1
MQQPACRPRRTHTPIHSPDPAPHARADARGSAGDESRSTSSNRGRIVVARDAQVYNCKPNQSPNVKWGRLVHSAATFRKVELAATCGMYQITHEPCATGINRQHVTHTRRTPHGDTRHISHATV